MASDKTTVVLTFHQAGIQPPVYVAGGFSSPPWHPIEMDSAQGEDGEHLFTKEVAAEPGSSIQYKFRIGHGDWWVLNEEAPSITDASGNRNNECLVPALPAPTAASSIPIGEDEERPGPSLQPDEVQEPDLDHEDADAGLTRQNTKLRTMQCPDDSDADEAIGLGEGETTEHVGSEDFNAQPIDHVAIDHRVADQEPGDVPVLETARVIAPPLSAEAAELDGDAAIENDAAGAVEAEGPLEALIATDEATSTGVETGPTSQVTSRRPGPSAAAAEDAHPPVPARPTPSGLQARTKDDDNWLVAFLRKIVVEWIGGIISRLCGGKRKTLLTATTAVVLTGLALWKMTGKDRRY